LASKKELTEHDYTLALVPVYTRALDLLRARKDKYPRKMIDDKYKRLKEACVSAALVEQKYFGLSEVQFK
jgi:hypothetical protein